MGVVSRVLIEPNVSDKIPDHLNKAPLLLLYEMKYILAAGNILLSSLAIVMGFTIRSIVKECISAAMSVDGSNWGLCYSNAIGGVLEVLLLFAITALFLKGSTLCESMAP